MAASEPLSRRQLRALREAEESRANNAQATTALQDHADSAGTGQKMNNQQSLDQRTRGLSSEIFSRNFESPRQCHVGQGMPIPSTDSRADTAAFDSILNAASSGTPYARADDSCSGRHIKTVKSGARQRTNPYIDKTRVSHINPLTFVAPAKQHSLLDGRRAEFGLAETSARPTKKRKQDLMRGAWKKLIVVACATAVFIGLSTPAQAATAAAISAGNQPNISMYGIGTDPQNWGGEISANGDFAQRSSLSSGLLPSATRKGNACTITTNPNTDPNAVIWPLPQGTFNITSRVGWRFNHTEMHPGVDMAAPLGTTILAALSGTVTDFGTLPGGGTTYLTISSTYKGEPIDIVYMHEPLSTVKVQKGQYVIAGTPIASVGSEGKSTGAHLHFQMVTNPGSHPEWDFSPNQLLEGDDWLKAQGATMFPGCD